jgi:acyl-CoA dehydrogenase
MGAHFSSIFFLATLWTSPHPEQERIRDAIAKLCERFGDDYWLARDKDGEFRRIFIRRWLRTAGSASRCRKFGGAGLGITEAAVMQAIAESGAGFSGASAVHMNTLGLNPSLFLELPSKNAACCHRSSREGTVRACCYGADAGLNTKKLKVKAEKKRTSTSSPARRSGSRPPGGGEGASLAWADAGPALFYTDFDRSTSVGEIEKMVRHAVDSNQVFFDGLPVPEADRIGEEGKGFEYILHGMNPERILIAAELVGLGRCAVSRAAAYAKQRIVFDRPIGQNQAIQHPLAANWMALEAANLMAYKAAWLYDSGKPCGAEANAAKYLAGEACFDACQQAVMTHGGYGYAAEYHVERYLRESLVGRIAPITPQLILCYIAERVLGLPKSY